MKNRKQPIFTTTPAEVNAPSQGRIDARLDTACEALAFVPLSPRRAVSGGRGRPDESERYHEDGKVEISQKSLSIRKGRQGGAGAVSISSALASHRSRAQAKANASGTESAKQSLRA